MSELESAPAQISCQFCAPRLSRVFSAGLRCAAVTRRYQQKPHTHTHTHTHVADGWQSEDTSNWPCNPGSPPTLRGGLFNARRRPGGWNVGSGTDRVQCFDVEPKLQTVGRRDLGNPQNEQLTHRHNNKWLTHADSTG